MKFSHTGGVAIAAAFALGAGATATLSSHHGANAQADTTHLTVDEAFQRSAQPGVAAATLPTGKPTPAAPIDSNIFVNLARGAVPAVVNISTSKLVRNHPYAQGAPDDMFRRFFEDFLGRQGGGGGFGPGGPHGRYGDDGPEGRGEGEGDENLPHARPFHSRPRPPAAHSISRPLALGTGFVIDASGIILTNNHVVDGADGIKVQFTEDPGEQPTEAKVIGRDALLDVALIQVKTKRPLTALPLGDSDSAQVGEYVLAIGNPFGQGHSASHGILSAKGRINPMSPIGSYLQTDAPINPGNSGGPLVNLRGEVIGINTAIDARAQGIGFAIPVNLVKSILPQLKEKGHVARGYIGAAIGDITPEIAEKLGVPRDTTAPFVSSVVPGGPAEKAGLRPYDVITSIEGHPVHTANELITAVTSEKVGERARLQIIRNGETQTVGVKLGTRPAAGGEGTAENEGEESGAPDAPVEPQSLHSGLQLENLRPQTAQSLGVSPSFKGALVTEVEPGSPAERAGLSRGDIIVEADRKEVSNVKGFYAVVSSAKKSYLLRVRKAGPGGQDVYQIVVLDLKGT